MSRIKVAIVEDDAEFRQRFARIVQDSEQLELVGTADTARTGYALIERKLADIYLVDLGLPDENGINLIRRIAASQPNAAVMVVTVFGDDDHVVRSIQAGATGYLLKDALPEEMVGCIRALYEGGSPVSPVIARRVLSLFRSTAPAPGPSAPNPLTQRETEVLTLVAKGLSFAEIGASLEISQFTVIAHVRKIYQKLAVHSRGEAVFEARQMGLLR
jgi:DNA-binding NarL/FixJ family response regulator